MRLYEIDKALLELMENGYNEECIDAETGEFYEDKFNELMAKYEAERKVKLENIGLYVKDLLAEADALKAEEKKLAERRKARENKAENLKKYAMWSMINAGDEVLDTTRVYMKVKPSSEVIADVEKLPEEYIREKITREADKMAIKAAWKVGLTVEGAEKSDEKKLYIR